jgi:hypothetical protein
VRLEELGQLKNPMTSSGIEPTNFRLVASLYVHNKKENCCKFGRNPSYACYYRHCKTKVIMYVSKYLRIGAEDGSSDTYV